MSKYDVKGLEGLNKQLRELGSTLAAKAVGRAARKAFKPVVEAARAKAPRDTGALQRGIRMAVVMPKGDSEALGVGIVIRKNKVGKKDKRLDPSWRFHFVEKGTVNMPAKPFLRPALDENASQVVETLKVELRASIARALAKAGK